MARAWRDSFWKIFGLETRTGAQSGAPPIIAERRRKRKAAKFSVSHLSFFCRESLPGIFFNADFSFGRSLFMRAAASSFFVVLALAFNALAGRCSAGVSSIDRLNGSAGAQDQNH